MGKYRPISLQVRGPLQVYVSDQALDIDNVRYERLLKVQDREDALHRRVRSGLERNDLHSDIRPLRRLANSLKLRTHHRRPAHSPVQGRLIEDRVVIRAAALSKESLPGEPRLEKLLKFLRVERWYLGAQHRPGVLLSLEEARKHSGLIDIDRDRFGF